MARRLEFLREKLYRYPLLRGYLRTLRWEYRRALDTIRGRVPTSRSEMTKELVHACVCKQDPTIIEVGCNDGTHSLWFLEIFEEPRIFCFEPDPRAISRFKSKVGQRPYVTLFEMAVSDHNGDVSFYQSDGQRDEQPNDAMPEGWDLSGSIRQPKKHLIVNPWVKFNTEITVRSTTLDAWAEEYEVDVIDFIWMDVQGAEADVVKGAEHTLEKTRFLYTEYSDDELYEGQVPLKRLLSQLEHFDVLIKYPGDVLLRNKRFEFAPNEVLQRLLADSRR